MTKTCRLSIEEINEITQKGQDYLNGIARIFQEYADTMRENERLREALTYIRDIEKPMTGGKPETDWLSWYTTSSQQTERAAHELSSKHSETEPSPFMGVSSAELFKTLGASPDEAEKMQRGLEAVVRREDMKHPSKT